MAHRRWLWLAIVLYVLFIYTSLPFTRYVVELVYSTYGRPLVSVLINTALGMVAIFVALTILRSGESLPQKAIALLLLVTGGILSVALGLPEERIHFVEYALLGYILFMATSTWTMPVLASALMVILVGSLDEAIQWVLPNRVGDLKDILLNSIGGALGINVAWICNKNR